MNEVKVFVVNVLRVLSVVYDIFLGIGFFWIIKENELGQMYPSDLKDFYLVLGFFIAVKYVPILIWKYQRKKDALLTE